MKNNTKHSKKLVWNYDACGEYADYKGHLIILQDHPDLVKYQICKEDKSGELRHIGLAATQESAKDLIDDLTTIKN